MNWRELIKTEIKTAYSTTNRLIDLVDPGSLDWKPATGSNWMTMSQLLQHLTDACGAPMRGFVTGDWEMPPDLELEPEDMLPTAAKMPHANSVDEVKALLAKDEQMALDMLAQCTDHELAAKMVSAPWSPREQTLGYQLLQMVVHLASHKAQLFYYLKLMGRPVNTEHLWGG